MAKAAVKPKTDDDPYKIHPRLEKLISDILDEYEKDATLFATKDKLAIVQIVGMFLTRRIKLRESDESDIQGSAVRRYSGAFRVKAADGVSGRATGSRPSLVADSDSYDDDPDDAA